MSEPTVNQLPIRRGVVMRAGGIEDSYGTKYLRGEGTGQLYRVSDKRRMPARLFDVDRVVAAMKDNADSVITTLKTEGENESQNLNAATA